MGRRGGSTWAHPPPLMGVGLLCLVQPKNKKEPVGGGYAMHNSKRATRERPPNLRKNHMGSGFNTGG